MRNTIIGVLLAVFGLATALRANDQPSSAVQPETQGQVAPETSQKVEAPAKEKKGKGKRKASKKEKKVEIQAEPKAEPAKSNE